MRWWTLFSPPCTLLPFAAWYHLGEPVSSLAAVTFFMVALAFALGAVQYAGALVLALLLFSRPPKAPDGAALALPDVEPDGPLRPLASPHLGGLRDRLGSAFQWAVRRSPRYLLCEGYALSSLIAVALVAYGGLAGAGRTDAFHRSLMDTGWAYLVLILLSTPFVPRALSARLLELPRKP